MSDSPFVQQQNAAPTQDPGKTMGILSVIFSGANFLGFPTAIVGLILGYVARNQSRKAGVFDNTLAKVGIILGWIAVALTVVGVAGIMIVTFAGNAVADKAADTANCISGSNSYSNSAGAADCSRSTPWQDGQTLVPNISPDGKSSDSPLDRFN